MASRTVQNRKMEAGKEAEIEDTPVMYCLNRHAMNRLSEKSEFHWYCPQCKIRSNGDDYRSDSDEDDDVVLKDVQKKATRLEDEKNAIKKEKEDIFNDKKKLEEESAEIARLYKLEKDEHSQTKAEKDKASMALEEHRKEVDRLQREMESHIKIKESYENSQKTIESMEKQYKQDIQAAKEGRAKEIAMLKEAAAKGDISIREKEAAVREKEEAIKGRDAAIKERDVAKEGMDEANKAFIEYKISHVENASSDLEELQEELNEAQSRAEKAEGLLKVFEQDKKDWDKEKQEMESYLTIVQQEKDDAAHALIQYKLSQVEDDSDDDSDEFNAEAAPKSRTQSSELEKMHATISAAKKRPSILSGFFSPSSKKDDAASSAVESPYEKSEALSVVTEQVPSPLNQPSSPMNYVDESAHKEALGRAERAEKAVKDIEKDLEEAQKALIEHKLKSVDADDDENDALEEALERAEQADPER